MKYARIDIETVGFVNQTEKMHINFGDQFQNIIIKDLYKKMGIPEDEIYVLDFNKITTYDGETLILPINQALTHNLANFISPHIIPVFLGLSRDTSVITEQEIEYLKFYSPVGCRDQALYDFLVSKDVKCYLNGCLSLLAEKREGVPDNAVPYVVDAPRYAMDAMPDELKNNAVFSDNTFYGTYPELTGDDTLETYVRHRYDEFRQHASVVITSRMHVASPCIGMGIPVICVRNNVDYRYSWIDKYIPVYSEADVDKIDWHPQPVKDVDIFKDKLSNLAIERIKNTLEINKSCMEITSFYKEREKTNYEVPQFSRILIDYIKKHWTADDTWEYAIWGENDASERLYYFLKKNYPKAKYVAFYDSFKKINYHGIEAQHPSNILPDDTFIFVTGYTASDAAVELFQSIGKKDTTYMVMGGVLRDTAEEHYGV